MSDCTQCGKRTTPDSIHTCSPQVLRDETLPEALKMGGLKYMRADGAAWGAFAACREGDVGAFPVVALDDLREAIKGARKKALSMALINCDRCTTATEARAVIYQMWEDAQ